MSMFKVLLIWALLVSGVACAQGVAQSNNASPTINSEQRRPQLLEGYADAFTYYEPLPRTKPQTAIAPKVSAPIPATALRQDQAVDFDWLKENYALLQKRAFNNPDNKDSVLAFAYTQRILMDKAQRFDDAMYEAVRTDPYLNEFNRLPTFWTQGAKTILNIEQKARSRAASELSAIGGLLVFVDGQCRFCDSQLAVLKTMRSVNNMQFLAISTDGTAPPQAKGETVQKDNGLFRKLHLQLTPTVVYVPRPKAYDGKTANDPNEYFIIAQGYYGVAELEKMLAFSAFKSGKYLSAEVRRDLDVWSTGVASNADLQNLKLDSNRPEEFKTRVEPLLRKQYPSVGGVPQ